MMQLHIECIYIYSTECIIIASLSRQVTKDRYHFLALYYLLLFILHTHFVVMQSRVRSQNKKHALPMILAWPKLVFLLVLFWILPINNLLLLLAFQFYCIKINHNLFRLFRTLVIFVWSLEIFVSHRTVNRYYLLKFC